MSEKPPPYSPEPSSTTTGGMTSGMTYTSFGPPPPAYGSSTGGAQLGWGMPPSQGMSVQQQGSVHVITQQPGIQPVIVQGVGTCPSCRMGVLRHQFTCPGILLCFCFFPIGILCLFALMERRCTHCYTSFG
ncbi:unnamed protein product [Meganyctiphanes norvegica]|uniref:Membrane protein BRI3 n=1 Tax=Meganyctiphanes norvegica TaxID=48144 RepID=A0AAV2RHC8_MEGNR